MIDDGADGFWNGLNIVWSCSHADSCSHAHPVKNGYYKGAFNYCEKFIYLLLSMLVLALFYKYGKSDLNHFTLRK